LLPIGRWVCWLREKSSQKAKAQRERNDVVRRSGDRGYGVERGVAGLHVPVPLRGPLPDDEGRP